MICIVSNSFGLMREKLEISPVWGKLQIKFPVRTKETDAIINSALLLGLALPRGRVTDKNPT